MNEIKSHSTSQNHFVVFNASEAVIEKASKLVAGGWAKIQSNGAVILHKNFRTEFESLINREAKQSTIAPEFSNFEEMESWIWGNVNSGKAATELVKLTTKLWNAQCAGLTIEAITKKAI